MCGLRLDLFLLFRASACLQYDKECYLQSMRISSNTVNQNQTYNIITNFSGVNENSLEFS